MQNMIFVLYPLFCILLPCMLYVLIQTKGFHQRTNFIHMIWVFIFLYYVYLVLETTGIGAATMLNMNLIPNPGDGIVQAIATKIQKNIGFTKNCVDFISLCTTIFIGLCFAHSVVGVGLGTVLAMIGVGRVISVYQFAYDKMSSFHT